MTGLETSEPVKLLRLRGGRGRLGRTHHHVETIPRQRLFLAFIVHQQQVAGVGDNVQHGILGVGRLAVRRAQA